MSSTSLLMDYCRLRKRQRSITREIVIDTETIGLDPLDGDRIVEIGATCARNVQIVRALGIPFSTFLGA
jgi:DNA polymerase III epsilon subunit-like protein